MLELPKKDHVRLEPETPDPLLEAIVSSSEDAIITKDLDGIITSWNPAAERIFGYAPKEIIGQSVLRLIPASRQYEEPVILRTLQAGEKITNFETRRVTKQGKELVVSLTISPLKDREGRVFGITKMARDVTHEKQLNEVRFQLAAIVESSDDAIMTKDLKGMITSWNRSAERIFGYTEEEMVGTSILTLIPEDLRSEEETIIRKIQSGERIDHYETVRLTKGGERLEVSVTISPLKDASGRIIGASKVLRTIGERKLMEKNLLQAEKIAATGRMAATIAHEINNPLESVLNLIYLARTNASDTSEVISFLNTAEQELLRVSHIAKQTLGHYREHSAALRVTLADLVTETLKIYEPKLVAGGIQIQTRFRSSSEIVLRKGEMMQVISNLITNAMYAMPSGGMLTAIVEDAVESGRRGVRLTIQDDGEGISAHNLKRIFEPFFTTRILIGTGIGLWVATEFIKGHQGKIDVQTSQDAVSHGTKMIIFLPFDNPYST
jgi:PAS domain S-box-containing protein